MKGRQGITRAFTLIELVVVLVIVVALASALLPTLGSTVEATGTRTAVVQLRTLRTALVGNATTAGFLGDTGRAATSFTELMARPADLADWDPATKLGWRGPYLDPTAVTIAADGMSLSDIAGAVIAFQTPDNTSGDGGPNDRYWRLVHSGPDQEIDTTPAAHGLTPAELELTERDDDIVLFLHVEDTAEAKLDLEQRLGKDV